ncbi:MAG: helix-turn-helix domain-containing protein [Cetobacterium sp.]
MKKKENIKKAAEKYLLREGFSMKEIAKSFGVSQSSVSIYLSSVNKRGNDRIISLDVKNKALEYYLSDNLISMSKAAKFFNISQSVLSNHYNAVGKKKNEEIVVKTAITSEIDRFKNVVDYLFNKLDPVKFIENSSKYKKEVTEELQKLNSKTYYHLHKIELGDDLVKDSEELKIHLKIRREKKLLLKMMNECWVNVHNLMHLVKKVESFKEDVELNINLESYLKTHELKIEDKANQKEEVSQ